MVGTSCPTDVRPFELAPPQTIGVQPLYLTARPATAADALAAWPWGLSALRLSVRYARRCDAGVVGAVGQPGQPLTLWWQAPQYRVQFRSALHSSLPAAGLPKSFRAVAVRALLPVVPDPQMPAQPGRPAGRPRRSADLVAAGAAGHAALPDLRRARRASHSRSATSCCASGSADRPPSRCWSLAACRCSTARRVPCRCRRMPPPRSAAGRSTARLGQPLCSRHEPARGDIARWTKPSSPAPCCRGPRRVPPPSVRRAACCCGWCRRRAARSTAHGIARSSSRPAARREQRD